MEIRSLPGIFLGALCVWGNYMFRSYFLSVWGFLLLLLLGFWSSIFAWFFFWWRNLHALILLFWWGFCCWFEFFGVRIFAATFRFSGGGI
jgi:hypothetical protein